MNEIEQSPAKRGRKKLPVDLKRMTASFCMQRSHYDKIQTEATQLGCSKSQVLENILREVFRSQK